MGDGEGWSPSLAYIRRGGGAFFYTTLSFSLSLSLTKSGLPWFGVCTWLGVSPSSGRRRAAGIGIRINLLSAALLVRSPEGRRLHCTCVIPRGTTRVVLLHRRRFFNTTGRS